VIVSSPLFSQEKNIAELLDSTF